MNVSIELPAALGTLVAIIMSLIVSFCASPQVAAQTPTATERDAAALALREQGVAAARAGNWEEATTLFQQSYDRVPDILTLYNLSAAQMLGGLLVEARAGFQTFLRRTTETQHETFRAEAARSIAELETRIAHVTIHAADVDRATMNGEDFPVSQLDTAHPMNPGSHQLVVFRDDEIVGRRDFSLRERQDLEFEVAIVVPEPVVVPTPAEVAAAAPAPATEPAEEQTTRAYQKPGLWIALIAIVAGGVIAGVLISQGRSDPYEGDLQLDVR